MEIIESQKEWERFLERYKTQNYIAVPVQCDDNKHPQATNLCLLYLLGLEDTLEFILPFRHTDTDNLDLSKLDELNTEHTIYTADKKKLLHFLSLKNVKDIQMLRYLDTNQPLVIEDTLTNSHEHFHQKFWKMNDLNCIIPILKHLEACRKVVDVLKLNVFNVEHDSYEDYNNEILTNLYYLEKNGIQTTDGMVYSEYNPYTSTGRPSNRFGGMNFAALNKKDGSRKKFISRFGKDGMLIEMDYDAYHLRLIGSVIDYSFPDGSVHQHLAKFYGVDYQKSKGLSFQYLYGHIPDDVIRTNPFFAKVQKFIDNLWRGYKKNNFIKTDIYYKEIFSKNLSDMNKNKIFNYLIQLMETENNMKMLTKLIPMMSGKKSQLVLYNYDSFLLDFYIPEGLNFIMKIKDIIEQKGKFPVKVSKGCNYHEMEDITRKFV